MTDVDSLTGLPVPSAELAMRQGTWPGQCFSVLKPAIAIGRQPGSAL
jgi:hypothetical protein